jgi:outer membrane protein assembly complex protein YaeT
MDVRWLLSGSLGLLCLAAATFAERPDDIMPSRAALSSATVVATTPRIGEISFTGLRHIAPAAVQAQISSRPGIPFDTRQIENDVRALAHLGWFESIRVEERASDQPAPQSPGDFQGMAIFFHLKELPFLSDAKFSGSRLLSQRQIEKLLDEKKLAPGLGKPADPVALQQIAFAIRSALHELAHPDASVRILRVEAPNATVSVRFKIDDGPLVRVQRVSFEGNPHLSTKLLHRQMRGITPWQPFASLRSKDAYTREAFEEDRQRLLTYYQNHGYPEARIGNPQLARVSEPSRRWLPWAHPSAHVALSLSIPVEAGSYYRLESVAIRPSLQQAADALLGKPVLLPVWETGKAYSAEDVEKLRRWWLAQLQPKDSKSDSFPYRSVETKKSFDPESHSARVELELGASPPYIVRRIEFQGLHKFSDRYMRRRIPLREGRPVDDRALEAGLARIARTGYFKPIRKEDIHVQMDDQSHTGSITIRVEEIGQQRASLIGGHAQFGTTLGVVYTVFDLLNREELLSAQLDGGPETLQIMLGIAKDSIFGTRASLAFSVLNNVVRPRFASSAQGPFFASHSEGISIPWSYPINSTDSVVLNYTLSRTTTEYPVTTPVAVPGVTIGDVRSDVSSRSLALGWAHDTGNERLSFSNSLSGGVLGGGENLLRSSAEYGRILRDPLFSRANSWAFRTTFSGAGSYSGEMPFYAHFFSADEIVRGLRPGELGPDALTFKPSNSSVPLPSAAPAGANLIGGANAEYRIPLGSGVEAAGFFDLGSGWLLPNWLGPARPLLLSSTNGVLHGSTGIELHWTVPGVQVPIRAYYAVNVLRLDRSIHFSDRSLFFARNRFSAFGWGLGSLF